MKKIFLYIIFIFITIISCKANETIDEKPVHENEYKNPILNISLPDPTIIKAENGDFYLYATEDISNIPIYKSENLVDWQYVGTAFTDFTRPTFEPNGGLWAPDSEIVKDDEGQEMIFYHAISVDKPHGRVLMMDKVQWNNDWPFIEGGSPSLIANKPIFN